MEYWSSILCYYQRPSSTKAWLLNSAFVFDNNEKMLKTIESWERYHGIHGQGNSMVECHCWFCSASSRRESCKRFPAGSTYWCNRKPRRNRLSLFRTCTCSKKYCDKTMLISKSAPCKNFHVLKFILIEYAKHKIMSFQFPSDFKFVWEDHFFYFCWKFRCPKQKYIVFENSNFQKKN